MAKRKHGKSHTATANRIAKRYDATFNQEEGYDIVTKDFVVEVETTATLVEGIERLKALAEPAYVAVTNKEAITEALRLVVGTNVGVMDPAGTIMRTSLPRP